MVRFDLISYQLHAKHGRAMYVRKDITDVSPGVTLAQQILDNTIKNVLKTTDRFDTSSTCITEPRLCTC